jgi:hypothetical protein
MEIELIAKIKNTLYLKLYREYIDKIMNIQFIRLIRNTKIGEKKNNNLFELKGIMISFINSLIPSTSGCNKPNSPVIFGPLLICTIAKTFRSNNVK